MRGVSAEGGGVTAQCRPHDLLRLARLPVLIDAPAWVQEALVRAPFVVVRRALAPDGFVAVGVRGDTRAQRYGCFVGLDDIDAVVAPEALLRAPYGLCALSGSRRDLPVFAALASLMSAEGGAIFGAHAWGPAGSAGFELATSVPTVTPASDLDLLIRAPILLSRDEAASLAEWLQLHSISFGIRIDVQLDTPAGGIALAEWATGGPRVLARSSTGPRLVTDLWSV
nr:malonate decarboxylase holo-ACP synthase [Paraburkholderia phosphatilytica]